MSETVIRVRRRQYNVRETVINVRRRQHNVSYWIYYLKSSFKCQEYTRDIFF